MTTILILICVAISSISQLLLKIGARREMISESALAPALGLLTETGRYLNPYVAVGLLLYAIGAFLWLRILSMAPLNYAITFTGLGMALTIILSRLALGESLPWLRVAGVTVILAGILLVAKSY